MIGRTLSHYEVVEKIGAGGMGEVYRARDQRLGRDVALKILPSELAGTSTELQRFQREARTLAGLDHPNIVTVYDIETVDGVTFMAMKLVEGQSLHELLRGGGLELERIFQIATPVADALSAAHEAGVTHRDLKPSNIVIGADGRVHVLDFGLAKVGGDWAEPDDATREMHEHLTQEGQIVGTVSYMSPEQAQGKPVDPRSDIFSFGVVLYQMATGDLPFHGDNHISVITSILRDQPSPVTDKNRHLPRHLSRIVRRCLQKEPARRYQSAKDLRLDLESLQLEVESGEWSSSGVALDEVLAPELRRGAGWRRVAPFGVGGVVLVALGLALGLGLGRRELPAGAASEPRHVETRRLVPLALEAGVQAWPSLTPGGDWFVYEALDGGDSDIFLRAVGGDNPINLTANASSEDTRPVVSPDGREIVFASDRQGGGLFVMGRTGESVRRVAEDVHDPAWSPDGRQLAVSGERVENPYGRENLVDLSLLDLETGQLRTLVDGQDAVEPDWSPHGHRIAFWGLRTGSGRRDLWTVAVEDGSLVAVTDDEATDWNPTWSPDGRYLYFASDRGGAMDLWRVRIDERTGQTLAPPEPVTSSGSSWSVQPSFSADGRRVVFMEMQQRQNILRLPFDARTMSVRGAPEMLTAGARRTTSPVSSPDGAWIAFTTGGFEAEDIYIMRADGSEVTQLTDDDAKDRRPRWSPDGKRLAFYSDRGGDYGVWVIERDGRGLRKAIGRVGEWANAAIWHPGGDSLVAGVAAVSMEWSRLVIAPRDGRPADASGARVLWEDPTGSSRFNPGEYDATGRFIVGTLTRQSGQARNAVLDTVDGTVTEFGEVGALTQLPVWIPNSQSFLGGQLTSLHVVDRITRESKGIWSPEGLYLVDFPSVSHDGQWIYLSPLAVESDIWMMEISSASASAAP